MLSMVYFMESGSSCLWYDFYVKAPDSEIKTRKILLSSRFRFTRCCGREINEIEMGEKNMNSGMSTLMDSDEPI